MRLDFIASRHHYAVHLAPIHAEAVRRGHTVDFHAGPATLPQRSVVIGSATGDMRSVPRRHFRVLAQHGVGQSYSTRHSSYPGGRGLGVFDLMLMPNQQAADTHLRYYPRAKVEVIGSPRVDFEAAADHLKLTWLTDPRPVVAVTWHWNCVVAGPYSGSAFPSIGDEVLAYLCSMRMGGLVNLIGHAHPRAWRDVAPAYERAMIPVVDFDAVLGSADLLIADNTSVMYEFPAITGKPVLVLDSPNWDESVHHGLRFWSHANVGLRTRTPRDVPELVLRALDDHPSTRARREAIVEDLFPHRGEAAARAVDAIEGAAG